MLEPGADTPTILLVEDETSIIALLRRLLRNLARAHAIVPCTDGLQALDALARHPVELVITDYRMPRLDGIELTRRVKVAAPQVRVLMLTAYGSPEVARLAREAGVDRFITKPFTLEALERAIDAMLAPTVP